MELKTAPIQNGGIVVVWRKPEIPAGWKECADLRGKTVVGWSPDEAEFNTLGAVIGEKAHTLTREELPNVNLEAENIQPFDGYQENGQFNGGSTYKFYRNKLKIPLGSGEAHNNIQPSKILMFIEPNFQ